MGFQQPNNVADFNRPAGNNNAGGQRQNWQNDAFVNLYLPRRDGTRAKVGSIGLKLSRKTDAQLIAHLANAPDLEEALNQFKDRLIMDFNRADGADSAELDLG